MAIKFRDLTYGDIVKVCNHHSSCDNCPFRSKGYASCSINEPWETLDVELNRDIDLDKEVSSWH